MSAALGGERQRNQKESWAGMGEPGGLPSMGSHKVRHAGQASLTAQLVKNPPAMQETSVQFLGWEDPLEKGVKNLPAMQETQET